MRAKIPDLITPSQEAVYGFLGNSTRWLTIYQISMLTGVSVELTRSAVQELQQMGQIIARKRIYGFDNGENEFKSVRGIGSARKNRLSDYRLAGVEPLSRKLQRILGTAKAREAEHFLQ